ncbi:MAG TPA: sulfatase-like hydrolase/transferase [Flavobacteriaceae bacterium]|nr:sulfatase-like hydrolase/transferase [Flavobacteriaceae bacterium]
MIQNIRLYEYLVFLYRIVLVYLFYFLARVLFVAFNKELLQVENFGQLMTLCLYGLKFDTTTIIYTNSLFIILSLLPIKKSTGKLYQKILFFVYFITNGVFMALNFIDFIYYRFTFSRSTINITESISNERNKSILFFNFLKDYWYIFLLFIVFIVLWVFLYKRIKVRHKNYSNNLVYYLSSIIIFLGIVPFCVAGIRGDFNHSTRPINIVDASNKVKNVAHSNVVLNTPFCIIRTISKKSFKKVNYVSEEEINRYIKPIKQYHFGEKEMNKLNVVIFIMESFSREYTGAFNSKLESDTYNSYTPFLDSLAGHSLIFDNAYTNGVKSIHAMPAILAGIPSFKDAFTSSSYSNTESESIVSVLKNEGYKTTFFHGAPNGSMGFLGYSNILGYNYYKGLEEYGKPEDFDGTWGIWDELFFQYVKRELTVESEPFFATIFSVSSHEPFKVPAQYEGKFPKGTVPIHQCIGYSDYALKRFFEEAAKEPWFKNTLFIITADHCNQVYEKEYLKKLNRTAIPILFYLPDNNDFKGINSDWAQHIDIYPTILDLLGYDKPFRSWGRSLLNTEEVPPFAINFLNHQYQFMQGDYICTFDGQKPTGFYHKTDKDFTTNLMDQNLPEFDEMLVTCKSFIQNYFDKIVDRDLKSPVK